MECTRHIYGYLWYRFRYFCYRVCSTTSTQSLPAWS
jgi:hypothetical protein